MNADDVLEDTSPPLNPAVATPSYTSTGPSNESPQPTRAPSKTQIALTDLVDFIVKPEDELEFYWPGGKKTICARMRILLMNLRAIIDGYPPLHHPTTI